MSVGMEQAADAILLAAGHISSQDELSDVDMDGDGDGSSSLSEIEDKDQDQDEDGELSDELSNPSDDENDSEAETERLEESPNKFRPHKDVVLNSHNDSETYERSPSKLHNQLTADDLDEEEDDDPLSDDDLSVNDTPESPKSSVHDDAEPTITTVPTSMESSSGESRTSLLSVAEGDTRKRKRSIMAGNGLDDELEMPVPKRIGSIMAPANDYVIEDDPNPEEDAEQSNHNSGNISDEEGGDAQDEEPQEEPALVEDEQVAVPNAPPSPKRRGRKKKKAENGVIIHVGLEHAPPLADLNEEYIPNGEEETGEIEAEDEADAQTKNEEELERKRIALDQLSAIEKQFTIFRDRLHEDRLEQLNREEAMLRQTKPTHPEYLAMMQCIDARRDERIRIAHKAREYGLQTLKIFAVSTRSQILTQYQQEVRETRELQLEQLGKQWYEIQHDRRSYAGSVPDYTLKFPTRRPQQLQNQAAYSSEVSILSGIAKYVGFPAAPPMLPASAAEMEDDFEKMGRTKPVPASALPYAELAALRSVGSSSRFKPAEEQFIEQTPWANPQHPSHAHLIQRQASSQQAPRTTSPFSQVQVPPRRHSHQQAGPIQGTFSNGTGRISPHNPFTNSHTIAPSPLGSQTSLSPQLNRPPTSVPDVPINLGISHTQPPRPREFGKEVRREQATATVGQF